GKKAVCTHPEDAADVSLLPVGQLLKLAAQRGLEVQPIQFDWQQLQTAIATETVLLLLTSGNVVAAIENAPAGTEGIVISDPLYLGGNGFSVTRTDLEKVWSGNALIVKPLPREGVPVTVQLAAKTGRSGSMSANGQRGWQFHPII